MSTFQYACMPDSLVSVRIQRPEALSLWTLSRKFRRPVSESTSLKPPFRRARNLYHTAVAPKHPLFWNLFGPELVKGYVREKGVQGS